MSVTSAQSSQSAIGIIQSAFTSGQGFTFIRYLCTPLRASLLVFISTCIFLGGGIGAYLSLDMDLDPTSFLRIDSDVKQFYLAFLDGKDRGHFPFFPDLLVTGIDLDNPRDIKVVREGY